MREVKYFDIPFGLVEVRRLRRFTGRFADHER